MRIWFSGADASAESYGLLTQDGPAEDPSSSATFQGLRISTLGPPSYQEHGVICKTLLLLSCSRRDRALLFPRLSSPTWAEMQSSVKRLLWVKVCFPGDGPLRFVSLRLQQANDGLSGANVSYALCAPSPVTGTQTSSPAVELVA